MRESFEKLMGGLLSLLLDTDHERTRSIIRLIAILLAIAGLIGMVFVASRPFHEGMEPFFKRALMK